MTEVTSETIVRMEHVRAARICSRGSRAFFAKHDLSWTDFLQNGIPASVLDSIGDPIALKAAAEARKEQSDGR